MKLRVILLLMLFAIPVTTLAQKAGLINSGDVIRAGGKLYDSSAYKKAITQFNRISRSDTNYVWSLYEKAITLEADSQYNEAIKICKEALALKEQRHYEPDLYNTYGNILLDMKQYDQAIKIFDIAIAKYPQYSLPYFNKGIVLMEQERPADAEIWFQKTLLINPYMYSAHYQLGLAAIQQGKLIQAFLSCTGYLLVSPQGKYFSKSISILSAITKGTDEILNLKNKRKETPDANYQTVEEIVLSKIALDKQYKAALSLDDPISRQMQVIFEKLEYDNNSTDFWIQYYLPYYRQVYQSGKFEPFVYHCFSNANVTAVKDYNRKNKKELEVFEGTAADYFNLIRATQQLSYPKRDTTASRYAFDNGSLYGKGVLINKGKTAVGNWNFYYNAGNIKTKGNYNSAGNREGEWVFYTYKGKTKSIERYVNGKLEGPQDYYYENGNPSSHENYVNNQLDGLVTVYYYAGNKKLVANYKAGKRDGEERTYFNNGNLKTVVNYTNGELNGSTKEYFKSGPLKEEGQNVNGKTEGVYKVYSEMGKLSVEMVAVKGKVEGEWKAYYDSGKLKEKRIYVNDVDEGLHQEYYENGQLAASYIAHKGKENGEAVYYNKDGKLYSKYVYDNGVIKSAQYFEPASGKQLSASEMSGNLIDIISYKSNGVKRAHFTYDKKGITGPDTVFYPSGKISQINHYKNGDLDGLVVNYYLNGKVKNQVNMTDGKENGYYESFYVNGQPESEGWVRNGDYQGDWVYHDLHGRLSSTSYYLDSELGGYKTEYAPDGKKTNEQKYYQGMLESMTQFDEKENVIAVDSFAKGSGKYLVLYPNKKVMAQGTFVNGEYNGAYKSFYFDGSVESSYFYKNGLLDSTYVSYYYGGKKHTEGSYIMGNRTGKWKMYREEGTLNYVSDYVHDDINGERVYYNPDGSKDYIAIYKDDELNGLSQKFDVDGSLAYQSVFEDDKLQAYTYAGKDGKPLPLIDINQANGVFKTYYANGKLSRECTYSDGEKNGKMTLYYSNGQVRSIDNEVYGVTNDVSKEYYLDGKLRSEYTYADDNIEGIAKEYNKNGSIKKEIAYEAGVNHGPAKYYDENGKLVKTLLYNYGKLMAVKDEK